MAEVEQGEIGKEQRLSPSPGAEADSRFRPPPDWGFGPGNQLPVHRARYRNHRIHRPGYPEIYREEVREK